MTKPKWSAQTLRELSEFLQTPVDTVKGWMKDGSFPPKVDRVFDLQAVTVWLLKRGKKQPGNATTEELKQRKLNEEIRRIELSNDKEQGFLCEREPAKAMVYTMFAAVKHRLLAIPHEISTCVPPGQRAQVIEDMKYAIGRTLLEMEQWSESGENLGEIE